MVAPATLIEEQPFEEDEAAEAEGSPREGQCPKVARQMSGESKTALEGPRPMDQPSDSKDVASSSTGSTASLPRPTARTASLTNLGNTCYMNSSLQCLAHIPGLVDFFLGGKYRDTLTINGQQSEDTHGKVAEAFALLLRRLWDSNTHEIRPSDFKDLLAKLDSRFIGNRQHDSMELLEFVIDALKEDCNTVKGKKPYVERADADGRPDSEVAREAGNKYLLRNDCFLDDLFVGFIKCATTCPEPSCGRQSVVFDPFSSVKVPLSPNRSGEVNFSVYTLTFALEAPVRQQVPVDGGGCAGDLAAAAAKKAGVAVERCLLVEIYQHCIWRIFDDADALKEIQPTDTLVLYELSGDVSSFKLSAKQNWGAGEAIKEGDIVVVTTTFQSGSRKSRQLGRGLHGKVMEFDWDGDARVKFDGIDVSQWVLRTNFGKLSVDLTMYSDERRICPEDGLPYTFKNLVEVFGEKYSLEGCRGYWRDAMRREQEVIGPLSVVAVHLRLCPPGQPTRMRQLVGFPLLFIAPREVPSGDLRASVTKQLVQRFGPEHCDTWELCRAERREDIEFADGGLEEKAEPWLKQCELLVAQWESPPEGIVDLIAPAAESSELTLEKCFEWLVEMEQLLEMDSVYCSGCKEHRRCFRRLEFWSLPPVLVLQLKRFEYSEGQRLRLRTAVHFPLEGLDLRPFCLSSSPSFPHGACIRSGQRVVVQGLQSEAGQKLNGLEGTAMFLDTATTRFCVQLGEDVPKNDWKKLRPENLVPLPDESGVEEAPSPVYDLVAVSKHAGSASMGHYVAYARSHVDGAWRLYDDEDVSDVTAEEVAGQRSGAYVLFYLRRDCRPAAWGSPAATA